MGSVVFEIIIDGEEDAGLCVDEFSTGDDLDLDCFAEEVELWDDD